MDKEGIAGTPAGAQLSARHRHSDAPADAVPVRRTGRLLQYFVPMPKMKSHSGAKKRFRKTPTGKLRGRHAMTSHILGKKSAKRKRRLGRPVEIAKPDRQRVRKLLGG